MRSLRSLLWFAALAAAASACSLGLDFNPEGQPCDARNQCLAGYICRLGSCVESDTAGDGGTPTGDGGTRTDGGTGGGSAQCLDARDCPEPR
jgi:hypothetical protein